MQRTKPNYNRGKNGSCLEVGAFLVFGFFGLLFLFFLFIQPMINISKAKNWVKVPCKISKSELSIRLGDSETGPTFYPDIQFQYQFRGEWRVGGQYNFETAYTSFEDACRKILAKYPVGLETKCFVDPENPQSAVLNRDYFKGLWVALFPTLFIILGFGGLFLLYRFKNKKKRSPTSKILHYYKKQKLYQTTETISSSLEFFNNEKLIKSKSGGIFEVSLLMITFWWNFIIFYFLKDLNIDLPQQPWHLLLPKAIGIFLMVVTLYYFFIFYYNKSLLELIDQKITSGNIVKFRLINKRKFGHIKNLTVSLIGEESTRISGGESGYYVTNKFYKEILFNAKDHHLLTNKVISCRIPENLMCSFKAKNNEIIWMIALEQEFIIFPKIKTKFLIKVAPL